MSTTAPSRPLPCRARSAQGYDEWNREGLAGLIFCEASLSDNFLKTVLLTYITLVLQGMADSAIDHLWKQKQAEIAQ